jgi:hypothetical protein
MKLGRVKKEKNLTGFYCTFSPPEESEDALEEVGRRVVEAIYYVANFFSIPTVWTAEDLMCAHTPGIYKIYSPDAVPLVELRYMPPDKIVGGVWPFVPSKPSEGFYPDPTKYRDALVERLQGLAPTR